MKVSTARVALLGDYDPTVVAHQAIPRALALACKATGIAVTPEWVHSTALEGWGVRPEWQGVWCVPASPYENPLGIIAAIRGARETGVPFLGTCGGFQHAILEVAESLWGVPTPGHAELTPEAEDPVITPLTCSLVEKTGNVRFAPDSRLRQAYGTDRSEEGYHCSYGLSSRYVPYLEAGPLRATAWDDAGEVRGVELDNHPFFVATLFQPERAALAGEVPPVVRSFVHALDA